MKKELVKKFGKELESISGLIDFLESQSAEIEDVQLIPEKGVAAFCLDKHWWSSGGGGIGMAAIVGVFRDGQEVSRSFTYRDQFDARLDNSNLSFKKVEVVEVTETSVTVKASTRDGSNSQKLTFDIVAAEPKVAESEAEEISAEDKAAFEQEVKKAMDVCVKHHKINHPLFHFPNQIGEHKVDHNLRIAAWILEEMIDTDRCTEQGSGWLGDQYRYSVWKMESGKEPVQIYEDHAYTKERGCNIRDLRLYRGKVIFTVHDGREITI